MNRTDWSTLPDPAEHVWGSVQMAEPERKTMARKILALPDDDPVLVEGLGWVPWGKLKAELVRRNEMDAMGSPWVPPPPTRPEVRQGFVYIIAAVEGPPRFKIGFAGNPEQRFTSIQAMSPVKLCLTAVARGSIGMERKLHGALAAHRMHGEWFDGAALGEARRLLEGAET